jgi:dolichyldiphosphatase
MCGKGYGMPSSHAQFLTFFSLSLTFFLLLRQRPSPPVPLSPTIPFALPPYVRKIVVSLGAMAVAAAVSASRVYLSYHTSKQVLVGCTAGAVSAVAWFAATEWARREGWVEWLLGWWVMKLARVRDLVVDEDVWESGWREWEGRKAGSRRQERGLKSKKAGKNS